MNSTVEAIYEDGVLKPTQPIALPEGTHVSVVITPTETPSAAKTPAEILAEIAALPLASNNQGFSNRDHDSVLYSTEGEA
jgi:predicted DNA-binding antitoxin AbrB/MazE fold protein